MILPLLGCAVVVLSAAAYVALVARENREMTRRWLECGAVLREVVAHRDSLAEALLERETEAMGLRLACEKRDLVLREGATP